jgi:heme exporter protein C
MKADALKLPAVLVVLGTLCLLAGTYDGLVIAPSEQHMGDVQRIMYIHVPTAWTAMLVLTWAFVCAMTYLFSASWRWDHRLEAAIETSVVLSLLLCIQGSIWAKPTWGVWWDWDPRLTTVAILLMAFAGISALRYFIEEPVKRATWTSVAVIIGYIDVPIVYFSVKWWNSLHQQQSGISTISREFLIPLLVNFAGMLLLITGVMSIRTRTAALRLMQEVAPPPLSIVAVEEVMA